MGEPKWSRRVTVEVEIIEERENSPFLNLVIDHDFLTSVLLASRSEKETNQYLSEILHRVLDKYRPRGTIEGSIEPRDEE